MLPFDALSFSISPSNIPVYQKDSLFNTNPNFDYGLFDDLKTRVINAGLDIDTFLFTFTEDGTYVFSDFAAPQLYQTIVKVSAECPET